PPMDAESFDEVLADIDRLIVPATTHWNSPGFMAYFASSSSAAGILGEMLAAAFNVNAMLWRASPAATELEQVAVDWLRQLVGLPDRIFGVINDTASSSTLHALAAARESLADLRIRDDGMSGRDDLPQLRVYASEEAHSSVDKACIVLGLGTRGVRRVAVDAAYRMDPDALQSALEEDVSAGVRPMAVVATVGTTSTTSVDPVPDIAAVCERHGVWLHVDAAYGGVAALVPDLAWVLAGAERADSLVVNPHKWLFTPIDCSVLWTRRPDRLRAAFSLVPEYLRSEARGPDEAPDLMDYGVSLGRRFRALKLWLVMRRFGRTGLIDMVRLHCDMAQRLAARVQASERFELMAPVPLSVVCLRAHPRHVSTDAQLDALNERVLRRINEAGRFFLSHTRLRGAFDIHVAFGHVRAGVEQVEALWDELEAALDAEPAA
ncbi:MAG TPA: aminotransferase class I/II-fold pyridoxal phosphate-dependent enzyme, partial [Candidatus Dormibacteraeota bacterium]|nr:aminotransferase class I/II-fold pyridoxal phosphate-dependent enzyme [Candidatus Dormibacteraeota bacterium]